MSPYAGPRIFLIDDDSSMRHAIERILSLGGYAPKSFSSAEALLDSGKVVEASCLILDVHLPGLTGFELYEELLRYGKPPPVIFITAYDEPESRETADKIGAAAYFTKPFSGRELVAAITLAIVARAEQVIRP
jgi:FixJ family two-component response regulator